MTTHSSILAWRIPWIEGPGGLPWGHEESDTTERLNHNTSIALCVSRIFFFFFSN